MRADPYAGAAASRGGSGASPHRRCGSTRTRERIQAPALPGFSHSMPGFRKNATQRPSPSGKKPADREESARFRADCDTIRLDGRLRCHNLRDFRHKTPKGWRRSAEHEGCRMQSAGLQGCRVAGCRVAVLQGAGLRGRWVAGSLGTELPGCRVAGSLGRWVAGSLGCGVWCCGCSVAA